MNTKQLECFINVAQLLNFSKAAKYMFVSQPTVTNQINSLEEELEVKLFERTKKSVILTAAGEEFYNDALEILTRFSMTKARLQDTQNKYQGKLSVGLSVNEFEKDYLPNFLDEFNRRYPNIYIFMQKTDHKSGVQNIIDNKIDILFFNTKEELQGKDICFDSIFSGHFCAIVNQKNPLSQLEELSIENLNEQSLLLPEKVFRRSEFQQLILYIQSNVSANRIQYCNDIELAKLMAMSNLGIMIVPSFEIGKKKDVNIIPLVVPDKIQKPVYGVAWNKRNTRNEVIEFVKKIEIYFKKNIINNKKDDRLFY